MNNKQTTISNKTANEKKRLADRMYGNTYRVVGYLPPRYNSLFNAFVKFNDGESKSSCLEQIVKKFFDAMPEPERQRIMNYSKNSY
ncbi:MAG: hypothetical protein ACJ749_07430 [Flavisolibacter sp.]|jgi:hypothetical protein